MKFVTFMAEIGKTGNLVLPAEIRQKLDLNAGDKVEISIKKIKKRRLDIFISQNPLNKILHLSENGD